MVKRRRPIKVIIGLNLVTASLTFMLLFLEGFILILLGISQARDGKADWLFALKFLGVMAIIWAICFLVALIICRKRLIVDDSKLTIRKGRIVLYETPIEDINWVEYQPFGPITGTGRMLLSGKRPVPEGADATIGWMSYKRIEKRIKKLKKEMDAAIPADCTNAEGSNR